MVTIGKFASKAYRDLNLNPNAGATEVTKFSLVQPMMPFDVMFLHETLSSASASQHHHQLSH